jgi:hypothetical protein
MGPSPLAGEEDKMEVSTLWLEPPAVYKEIEISSLMVLPNILGSHAVFLLEFSPVPGCNVELLATVQKLLRQLALIRAVVAVEESLISPGDDKLGDVHLESRA